jgi:hypothetical protein
MDTRAQLSVRETAIKLGIAFPEVYRLLWQGKLRGTKIDGIWQVEAAGVEKRLLILGRKRRDRAVRARKRAAPIDPKMSAANDCGE